LPATEETNTLAMGSAEAVDAAANDPADFSPTLTRGSVAFATTAEAEVTPETM
jgi:hypothetical protein